MGGRERRIKLPRSLARALSSVGLGAFFEFKCRRPFLFLFRRISPAALFVAEHIEPECMGVLVLR